MTEKTTVEKIAEAGVKSVTTDGSTTVFVDPKELRKQIRRQTGANTRRPVVSSINLSGT